MSTLEEKKPRLFYYESEKDVWGFKVSVFAPEIGLFLAENYTDLAGIGYPGLYVRNDYYTEAVGKLTVTEGIRPAVVKIR